MPAELSPESKLYVKEEIEKVQKETKEEIEKVRSKATKTFAAIATVVGLLTCVGVYGIAAKSINDAIERKLVTDTVEQIRNHETEAKGLYDKIAEYETDANDILSSLSLKMTIGTIVPYGGEIVETKPLQRRPQGLSRRSYVLEATGSEAPGDPCQVQPGWFFCNGASLKRDEYKDLFKVIRVSFGAGDGKTTFNLPDLRGRFVRGVDHGTGRDPDAVRRITTTNGNTGDNVGSIQDDELKKHKHLWRGYRRCGSGDREVRSRGIIKEDPFEGDCLETGGNETRPKNIYVNWIIKAQ